jgi:integrase
MVLDLLAQILDDAVDYKLLDANPARGKRRRMKVPKSRRTFLEPDMVVDLLNAAGEWERSLPEHQHYGRRAVLATLCLAGPRISELTNAPRARLDLHGGRLRVGEAKTEAGLRDLELTAFLLDELRTHLAAIPAQLGESRGPAVPVFPTRSGGRLSASNLRNRLLKETVRRVNETRARAGRMLLPEKVTPHTLRRTFASLALAAGRDPRWVMAQLGHTDARLTLNLYAQVVQRQRVDEAPIWQLMRFRDEPEERRPGRTFETKIETTDASTGPGRQKASGGSH